MKRAILTTTFLGSVAFFLIGADFQPVKKQQIVVRKHCSGYTIIEAGKGVDCYGDTIRLVKKHGFFEIAAQTKK